MRRMAAPIFGAGSIFFGTIMATGAALGQTLFNTTFLTADPMIGITPNQEFEVTVTDIRAFAVVFTSFTTRNGAPDPFAVEVHFIDPSVPGDPGTSTIDEFEDSP